LEERAGERRLVIILDAAVRGDIPAACRTNTSGVLVENDDLLSLPLSSKGGEGNCAAASEHRDMCKEQTAARLPSSQALFPVNPWGVSPYSPELRRRAGWAKVGAVAAYENVVFRN
jgi:hypothetical protein